MIPKICANCAYGNNINNELGQITMTLCHFMPITVAEAPNYSCGCFDMGDNPQIVLPDHESEEEDEG